MEFFEIHDFHEIHHFHDFHYKLRTTSFIINTIRSSPMAYEKIEDEYFKSANFVKQFYDSFFHILNSMYNDGLII